MVLIRILVINTVRFRLNGITSVIMNYYRNMDRSNLKMDFVVINELSKEYKEELTSSGSEYFLLPRKSNPIKYIIELKRLIKKNQYDVVHIHGNSSFMLLDTIPCKLAGVKRVIVHSHNTTCKHVWIHKVLKPVFSKTYTLGLACGEDAGKWLYGKKEFQVLRNGIDTKRYAFDNEVREEYRKKINAGDKIVIGHIGNFIEQKNHSFLLDVFADLKKESDRYLLLLISDGALLDQMKDKAVKLGIEDSVIFLGKTLEVPQYLQAMDIFVLPSLFEGLPVVLIEALAAGLPCIVSDRITKEVDLANVFRYIDINNSKHWADSIMQTDVSEKLRDNNSQKWIKTIEEKNYDIVSNAGVLKAVYEDSSK